ncbi:hypothetical protein KOW79_020097 [Hemibagrus wyckioides]|uniref:Uncharacterized protein n=1 Tax=Hemibagrus wyckioides TaxID=337641 RepID=A0A9D3N4N7_9TELE|nr:hypothetical protein KOW79_020097 [Hemibagrus wyckioides]
MILDTNNWVLSQCRKPQRYDPTGSRVFVLLENEVDRLISTHQVSSGCVQISIHRSPYNPLISVFSNPQIYILDS